MQHAKSEQALQAALGQTAIYLKVACLFSPVGSVFYFAKTEHIVLTDSLTRFLAL